MLAVSVGVGAVSALYGAGAWTILARILGTLFVAQALYVLVVLTVARGGSRHRAPDPKPQPRATDEPAGYPGTPGESS